MLSYATRAGRWPLALTLAALAALSTACSPTSRFATTPHRNSSVATASPADFSRFASSSNLLTYTEAHTISVNSAYELVSRLRPQFLRGTDSRMPLGPAVAPVVYVDGLLAGPLSTLVDVPAQAVQEIRFVSPNDAFMRHGESHAGGMLVVRLIKR